MTQPQSLIEINKYRIENELTPWRRLWTQAEQREWAVSVNEELALDVQDHMLDSFEGAAPITDEINISPFLDSADGQGTFPTRAYPFDGGLDIYGNADYVVNCHGPPTSIFTGYRVEIPRGMVGRLIERSG